MSEWMWGNQPMVSAMSIPVELFQILKDDAVKVLHSICQKIWKTQQWPQDCKRSVFIPIQKKGNAKECSNYCTIALISHASKVMLKILQARLQQYVNRELPDPWGFSPEARRGSQGASRAAPGKSGLHARVTQGPRSSLLGLCGQTSSWPEEVGRGPGEGPRAGRTRRSASLFPCPPPPPPLLGRR